MALQGVNIALMPLGADAVWARAYRDEFDLAAADLEGFWPGPAFLAWGRMGNVQGCAAPAGGSLPRVSRRAGVQPLAVRRTPP